MKTLSLKLPDDLDARISAIAKRRQSNKSEVARYGLADACLVRMAEQHAKGTVLTLDSDFLI